MHARRRWTDRQTDEQTADEHHGNSATICSDEHIAISGVERIARYGHVAQAHAH